MRLLVLGGTSFVGRHLVNAALGAGHSVSTFTRGRTNPDLFPDVEHLRGDRRSDLSALEGRSWDAVVDLSGYFSPDVERSATLLQDSGRYIFVSTVSVYADDAPAPLTEDSPLATLPDGEPDDQVTATNYGPFKRACEVAALSVFGERGAAVRPGLIVGPYDPSDRFTYWTERFLRKGPVLAPAPGEAMTQFIDGRDLAGFLLGLAESGPGGVFNATGPAEPVAFTDLLDACREAAGGDQEIRWVPEERLLEAGAGPWLEVPLWIPQAAGSAIFATDCGRARAAGLRNRPFAETVADTLAWARTLPADRERRAGLTPEREAELFAALAEPAGA